MTDKRPSQPFNTDALAEGAQRLRHELGRTFGKVRNERHPAFEPLVEAMAASRRARLEEDYPATLIAYDRALESLDRMGIKANVSPSVVTGRDTIAGVEPLDTRFVIEVNRVEILLAMHRWADAETLIARLENDAGTDVQRGIVGIRRAMLTEARGDLDGAREQYDAARRWVKTANGRTPNGGAKLPAAMPNTAYLPLLEGVQGRAACQLADLALREGNASFALHLFEDGLPRFLRLVDIFWSPYFTGRMGEAMMAVGRESDGYAQLGRALQMAEEGGNQREIRRWSLVLGQRAMDEARYNDAQTHIARALNLFDSQNPTPAYVRALCLASRVHIFLREADKAVKMAETALRIAPAFRDPALLAAAQGAMGVALRAAGRSSEAIGHLQAAAEVALMPVSMAANASLGSVAASINSLAAVEVLRALGAAQLDAAAGDMTAIETAVTTYTHAVERARTAGKPLDLAQALRDLGLGHQKAGRDESALPLWTEALNLYKERSAHAQIARLYSDIGSARKALGQNTRAMKEYENALTALNSVEAYDSETRGVVLSNAANAYAEMGDAESADSFFSEAIAIAGKLGDRTAESVRMGNYGWFLLNVGRPRRAISSLGSAIAISETLPMTLYTAVQTDNLACAHDALSEYPAALEKHLHALSMIESLDQPYWSATFTINLGHTHLALNDAAAAEAGFERALAQAQAMDNVELIVRALCGRSLTHMHRMNTDEVVEDEAALANNDAITRADAAAAEAVNLARRADLRRWLADALAIRSQTLAAKGDGEAASTVWAEAVRLYTVLHMPQAKLQPAWLRRG